VGCCAGQREGVLFATLRGGFSYMIASPNGTQIKGFLDLS
jgi:hypothetical protein